MSDKRHQQIIEFVKQNGQCSSKDIFDGLGESYSYATLKRILTDLKTDKQIFINQFVFAVRTYF